MEEEYIPESKYALQIAFQTMKERCQHLQSRLLTVEEENTALRQQCEIINTITMISGGDEKNNIIQNQQVHQFNIF